MGYKILVNSALPRGSNRWAIINKTTGETIGYYRTKKEAQEEKKDLERHELSITE